MVQGVCSPNLFISYPILISLFSDPNLPFLFMFQNHSFFLSKLKVIAVHPYYIKSSSHLLGSDAGWKWGLGLCSNHTDYETKTWTKHKNQDIQKVI